MNATELGLVNRILSGAKEKSYADADALNNTELGRQARTIYNEAVERQLSTFPWPFAIRRATLLDSGVTPLTTWTHYYVIPEDAAGYWDVYVNEPNFRLPNRYDFSLYKGYFSGSGDPSFAALENEYIASIVGNLKLTYTTKSVRPEKFPYFFRDAVVRDGAIELAIIRGMSKKELDELKDFYTNREKKSKEAQSLQNPGRKRMGPGRMVRNILGPGSGGLYGQG